MSPDDELASRVREIVTRVLSGDGSRPQPATSVAIGSDHGGFELKQELVPFVTQLGYTVTDCGTFSSDPVDYPDIAYAVAKLVSDGRVARGIIIDGAGIGSCIVANKVPGVRAAMCYDAVTARNAREHNDANVVTLGGRLIPKQTALEVVKVFLETRISEPRHLKRVEKITQVERRYLRR